MSKPLNILISGSGIAGSAFARCMLRAHKNANITIVERAPELRLSGASVDIRSYGVDIIKWMGIEAEIRENTTNETGTAFVRADGSPVAVFNATGNPEYQSMTSEYEIFRGALANILIRPVLDKIKLIFNESIDTYEQVGDKVNVTFTSQRKDSYDLLIAADGVGSKIRGKMLGAPPREQVKDTGCRVAFFTINKDMLNGSTTSQWRSMSNGRGIYLRPDPSSEGRTRGHFMVAIPEKQPEKRARFDKALAQGNDAFMRLLEEEYKDGDWLSADVLKEMRKSSDFYCSIFAQVRSPKLQDGRVVLLGDAGHATPGIGTSLAITAAYVLAGELLKTNGDVLLATKQYEEVFMPYVKTAQIDFDPMSLLLPQTEWGIGLRDTILWCVTKSRIMDISIYVAGKLGIKESNVKLPTYPWPAEV